MTEAFADAPGTRYMFRSASEHARWHPRFSASHAQDMLRRAFVMGAVATRPDDDRGRQELVGVVDLYPVGEYGRNRRGLGFYFGVLRLLPMAFWPGLLDRVSEIVHLTYSMRALWANSMYVSALAVKREHRRQGIGVALMKAAQARAAGAGRPIFLHSWSPLVPYYERLGFRTVDEAQLPGMSVSLHGMATGAYVSLP